MTIEELKAKLETVSRERDEARAEVERLRAGKHTRDCRKQSAYNVACVCGADDAKRAEVTDAYRRGAEAMQAAAASRAKEKIKDRGRTTILHADALSQSVHDAIRALPIPGDP